MVQKHEKARREKAGSQAVEEIDENFIRLYWEQMLQVGRPTGCDLARCSCQCSCWGLQLSVLPRCAGGLALAEAGNCLLVRHPSLLMRAPVRKPRPCTPPLLPPQAVDTIHHERIVHSDLKPANFLVVEGQLKLIDFGIAKAIQSGAAWL